MAIVQLPEAKAFLKIDDDTSDDELQRFINAAESVLADRVGPLSPVTATETVDGNRRKLVLLGRPVASITSITSRWGTVVDTSLVRLETRSDGEGVGIIEYKTGLPFFEDQYTVVYQRGWQNLPESLKNAIRDTLKHLWKSIRGPGRGKSPSDGELKDAASAFLLTYRIEGQVAPHKPILVY